MKTAVCFIVLGMFFGFAWLFRVQDVIVPHYPKLYGTIFFTIAVVGMLGGCCTFIVKHKARETQ